MAPPQQQTARHISTASRVHPSYLPYLQAPRPPMPRVAKLIPPAVALVGIGYGVSMYRQAQREKEHHISSPSSTHNRAAYSSSTHTSAEQAQRQREQNMQDAYGDRESLDSLEEAIRVYEQQRR